MHEQAPINHQPPEVLPPEADAQPEKEPVLSKIRINYGGILSDRMHWNIGTLSTFEQISDLRSHVTITNEDTEESNSAVTLGDTMALKSNLDASVLFERQSSPKQNLKVTTNLSSGQAVLSIDDNGIAKEMMKDGKAFDQEEFIRRIDNLVKTGFREVLAKEKHLQLEFAARNDFALSLALGSGIPVLIFYFDNFIKVTEDLLTGNYEDSRLDPSFWAIMFALTVIASIGNNVGKGIVKKQNNRIDNEFNYAYFNDNADLLNPINPIADKQKAKRFLKNKNNTLVRLKEAA